MPADIISHPDARFPTACDDDGQFWLPPVWLFPESPDNRGCIEFRHVPEYLVRIGRAKSSGEAQLMMVEGLLAAEARRRLGDAAPELVARLLGRN